MQTFNIETINEDQIPVEFRPENIYASENFEQAAAKFREWLKANSVFYYARPREDFYMFEAYELAHAAGCSKLLLEDMS